MMTGLLGPFEQLVDSVRFEGVNLTLQKSMPRLVKAVGILQPRRISLEQILCSGEHAIPSAQYARITGDLLRPSRRFTDSPHVQLLELYRRLGEEVFEPEEFHQTLYYLNALQCIRVTGHYFHCLREDQVVELAKQFVVRFLGETSRSVPDARFRESFSPRWKLPTVRRIRWSNCYELIDGNHRLAMEWLRGRRRKWVWVVPGSTVTPLQQLLLDVTWTRGSRELYQPIDSPELTKHWRLVRRCDDRFRLIKEFLSRESLLPPASTTSLDVACSYGWFVREFQTLGFKSQGIEIDWASKQLGQLIYRLAPDQVIKGDVVAELRKMDQRVDVTTCFSLLHHFVLGRGSVGADEMLRLLDRVTGRVLFLDTGEGHERWFSKSLAQWNPDFIEAFIKQNSSFRRVYRLDTDQDGERYPGNYGRTLFACLR